MSTLVFDIETIPDLDSGRAIYNLHDLTDDEVLAALSALRRAKTGKEWFPHFLQKIVAISLVLSEGNSINVWSLGSEVSTEKELIQRFYAGIDKYTPTLVSWNGCGFDLPVLHYRTLLHQVAASTYWECGDNQQHFRWNNYLNRFHYRHLDLMDILASYQAKAFAPLDDIASFLGFPGKMGMSGAQVFERYRAQDLKSIRDYCETDVLNTYCIYLRFELMRGLISISEYTQAMNTLFDFLSDNSEKNHLKQFLELLKPVGG